MNQFSYELLKLAKNLPYDYQTADENMMMDAYCDCATEPERSWHFAAVVLRHLYQLPKIKQKLAVVNYGYEDCQGVLCDGVLKAARYKGWRKPGSKTNAQACVNQAINTVTLQVLYDASQAKRRLNYFEDTVSLDQPVADPDGGKGQFVGDMIADGSEEEARRRLQARMDNESLIERCVSERKLTEAVVLDVIMRDPDAVLQKTSAGYEVSVGKCGKAVRSAGAGYAKDFAARYGVKPEEMTAVFGAVRSASRYKLGCYLDSAKALAQKYQ